MTIKRFLEKSINFIKRKFIIKSDPEKKHAINLHDAINYYRNRIERKAHCNNNIDVSIIILSYNNRDYSELCLRSIYCNTDYQNYEIIVVDNASSDDSQQWLADFSSDHDNLKLILNKDNKGFAGGNNQAAKIALGEYLIFLNNDTIVTEGWIQKLKSYFNGTAIGLIGPVTNAIGNEACIKVNYHTAAGMEQFARERAELFNKKSFDIRMLAFYCVMAKKETYLQFGGLDERYTIGMFEDDDIAVQYREKGYRVVCVEDVFIHHFHGASFGKLDQSYYNQIFEDNKKSYEKKWGRSWQPYNIRS